MNCCCRVFQIMVFTSALRFFFIYNMQNFSVSFYSLVFFNFKDRVKVIKENSLFFSALRLAPNCYIMLARCLKFITEFGQKVKFFMFFLFQKKKLISHFPCSFLITFIRLSFIFLVFVALFLSKEKV